MKKKLPVILLVLGVIVFVGSLLLIRGNKKGETIEEEGTVAEIPFEKRPIAALYPSEDGHWLKMKITKVPTGFKSLDYELLYKLLDGRTQGVPGTITLSSSEEIERDLLLGSESSGKFRYDEGVENGTLTLRFRDEKGKLAGKLSTEFNLLTGTSEIVSADSKFKLSLAKKPKGGFFVVMETFGIPETLANIQSGPYGVFSSLEASIEGQVTLAGKINLWNGNSWKQLAGSKTSELGIFVGTSE